MLEINRPFLQLYHFCSDQLLLGAGGPVALNFLAVDRAMDYFEVDPDERVEFYEKVRGISRGVLDKRFEQQEQERRLAAMKSKKAR